MPNPPLGIKSLLATETLNRSQIETILTTASFFKKLQQTKRPFPPLLSGKTISLLFFEASTRTRSSFEIAIKRLGGNSIVLTKQFSSTEKGETLFDTAKTIEAMAPELLVLRHPCAGTAENLDRILNIPVVNAGDGFHEHPTQALLDLMTILEFKPTLNNLRVLIVGDIAHSRVARSNIYALKTMGAKVTVCGPPTLLPPRIEELGVHVSYDLHEAVAEQDVIMMLRIQLERMNAGQLPSTGEYAKFYGLSEAKLKWCRSDVLIMHPGPMNRGVEISPDIADGKRSLILNQVANGVLVRMAVLHLLTGGEVLRG